MVRGALSHGQLRGPDKEEVAGKTDGGVKYKQPLGAITSKRLI